MQHVDLKAAKAAKASDRKSLAILAYDNACQDPSSANWRGVADLLRLALPNTKAKAIETPADSRYAQWADYSIPQSAGGKRLGKSPVVVVTFADGETVRAPAVSLPGKPVNIGRALRVAVSYYQGRIVARYNALIAHDYCERLSVCDSEFVATIPVPAVVSAICETTGAEYDPAACCEMVGAVPVASPDIVPAIVPATADFAGVPATADFVPASRYLDSSSLVRDIPLGPVAPSCILRVA
jgi:hypothetical protein